MSQHDAIQTLMTKGYAPQATHPAGGYIPETLNELIKMVQDEITAGYDVDFVIRPNSEDNRYPANLPPTERAFFTTVSVWSNNPISEVTGEFSADDDGNIFYVSYENIEELFKS